MATQRFTCANWDPDSSDCKKFGEYSCKNCLLVVYCSQNCQKAHWGHHKIECKSVVGKEAWSPDWALEGRMPAFIRGGLGVQYGGKKYLWGNTPALDVLHLGANEGGDYGGQLNLLFAASGDIRNVAKTIAQIPDTYNQSIALTLNDRDPDIVARNAIMLLIALIVDDIDDAVDCIIHLWYSALIRESDLNILQQRIRPLIESVCESIKKKAPTTLLGKTWTFGHRSLRLVLEKSSWDGLLFYTDIPKGLTAARASQIRTLVTLAESRKDYLHRSFLFQSGPHRIAKMRFRRDGLLLPFGARRDEFQEPNPTFFQNDETWPMRDNADPLHGWSLMEVENCSSGPATADIYGKLFYHIRAVLKAFLLRLSHLPASFRLLQVDVADLSEYLEDESFSRIEVSNIADSGYLGVYRTVGLMSRLLQKPLMNPHATLITLFMNAVGESLTIQDRKADMTDHSPTSKRLLKYLPPKGMPTSPYDPQLIKFDYARDSVATYDHIFDRFKKDSKWSELAQFLAMEIKEKHTIIEKWPFRLKLRPGQPGAQEEFDRLLGGGLSGQERYVEWERRMDG